MDEKIRGNLRRFFSQNPLVKMAFLFGSQAKHRGRAESDVDLAIWPEENTPQGKMDSLWVEVEKIAGRSVDLVILPQARPTIAWEAMRGIPLVIKDKNFHLNRMLEISDEAEDFQDFVIDVWNRREGKKA